MRYLNVHKLTGDPIRNLHKRLNFAIIVKMEDSIYRGDMYRFSVKATR
jgi:hypothetical protein